MCAAAAVPARWPWQPGRQHGGGPGRACRSDAGAPCLTRAWPPRFRSPWRCRCRLGAARAHHSRHHQSSPPPHPAAQQRGQRQGGRAAAEGSGLCRGVGHASLRSLRRQRGSGHAHMPHKWQPPASPASLAALHTGQVAALFTTARRPVCASTARALHGSAARPRDSRPTCPLAALPRLPHNTCGLSAWYKPVGDKLLKQN